MLVGGSSLASDGFDGGTTARALASVVSTWLDA
jgi:hypothetical protein